MFDSLRDGLQSAFKTLRGKGTISETNMRDGLKLVEQSLLDADVSYSVVKDFMERVTTEAVGERVLKTLDPSEQVVKIVHDVLVDILGPVDSSLHLKKDVNIIMLCGLQGSGKTTTCGKLAQNLKNNNIEAMLVAADLQRPAAIDQLHVIGEHLGVPVYSDRENKDPVKVCQDAVQKARAENRQVVILDTAGRLAIDEALMAELTRIDNRVHPDQVYLVVDGMTGQDAVNSAGSFNEALELDGVIMTKLDGDARGGALLSVKHVTGVPIKFIGTGEHLDALEHFRPEGMAGRILGLGDILAAVEKVEAAVSEEERLKMEEAMRKGEFTLENFRDQLKWLNKPGFFKNMLGLLPGMGQVQEMMQNEDTEGEIKRVQAIIDSMTPNERRDPSIVNMSRRVRIAQGCGLEPPAVNDLIKQFEQMKPIMKMMSGKGAGGRMQAMRELQDSGMFDPGGQAAPKSKGGTGKKLSPKERAKLKKDREKQKRRNRRKGESKDGDAKGGNPKDSNPKDSNPKDSNPQDGNPKGG
jgi:signal recognition particle subunit SRP54